MTFGDPVRFAISIESYKHRGGSMLYGYICYWIGSKIIGDWSQLASLSDANWDLSQIVCNNGRRRDCDLFSRPKEITYNAINTSIYRTDGVDEVNLIPDAARFEILPNIPVFGQWTVLLVKCSQATRLLYKPSSGTLESLELEADEAEHIIKSAYEKIELLYTETNDGLP